MDRDVTVWYDREGDSLEMLFEQKEATFERPSGPGGACDRRLHPQRESESARVPRFGDAARRSTVASHCVPSSRSDPPMIDWNWIWGAWRSGVPSSAWSERPRSEDEQRHPVHVFRRPGTHH